VDALTQSPRDAQRNKVSSLSFVSTAAATNALALLKGFTVREGFVCGEGAGEGSTGEKLKSELLEHISISALSL